MDLELSSWLLLHASCYLAAGMKDGVIFVSQNGTSRDIRSERIAPPDAAIVARFVCEEDPRSRRPPSSSAHPPEYVIARHRLIVPSPTPLKLPEWATLLSLKAARYTSLPGIYDDSLWREVWRVVMEADPELMWRTLDSGLEQTGLVLYQEQTHTVSLRLFQGHAEHMSVEPHCRGQRGDGPPPESHTLIGEFHTHPKIPPADIAPPSAADLYQLALSAGMREHNLSFILAAEGVYACHMEPRYYEPLMTEVHEFLKENRMSHRTIRSTLNACEQPILERVRRDTTPLLHTLLSEPGRWFRDLMRPRDKEDNPSDRLKRIETFCTCCRTHLGIHINFRPRPPLTTPSPKRSR